MLYIFIPNWKVIGEENRPILINGFPNNLAGVYL